MKPVADLVSIDHLDRAIVNLAARINAETYELLLCSRHHQLVHEGGFTIERDYQNQWFFKRPDGRAVPACGYLGTDVIDEAAIDKETGEISGPFNNPPAGGFATKAKTSVSDLGQTLREPPAPAYWH